VEKYPTWSSVEDFLTRQKISWHGFSHRFLQDKTSIDNPADKLWSSHYESLLSLLPKKIVDDINGYLNDEDGKRKFLHHYLVVLYETAVKSTAPHELLESARKRLTSEEGKAGE
jgi:hypothetical protein